MLLRETLSGSTFWGSKGGQPSTVEGSDSLLTTFLNEFSLFSLFISHKGCVLVNNGGVLRTGDGTSRVIGVESHLSSGDVEIGEMDGVL